jgi:hypothetical protein
VWVSVCLFVSSCCIRPLCGHGIYTQPNIPASWPYQLMRLPHPLPIRPLSNRKTKTKQLNQLNQLNQPGPRLRALPVLPRPHPASISASYILALRPHACLELHANSPIPVFRLTVILIFLQVGSSQKRPACSRAIEPTSVCARNSKMAGVHLSSPKSCSESSASSLTGLPSHMVTRWSFHRLQCLRV